MRRTLAIILCLHLCACATKRPELKAPCDPIRCHQRTDANTWYKA